MKYLAKKWLSMSLVACLVLAPFAVKAKASQTFEDNFDGTALDSAIWNTAHATEGKRWCSSTTTPHHSNPGNWLYVESEPCHNFEQAPPFGNVAVGSGKAGFSSGYVRAFPFIWAGPPSRVSPFPETGDFVLEIRMKYDSIRGHGDGLQVLSWDDSDPVGNNPPLPPGKWVFGIWADTNGLRTNALGGGLYLADRYSYHTYRLDYVDNKYSLYVDGILRAGPTASTRRPNTIWIGNPVFTHWGIGDWSDFTIDFIRVTALSLEVSMDIKPGSDPNCVNNNGKGVIPVAVFGGPDFDVKDIEPESLTLEGLAVKTVGKNNRLLAHYEDVNNDGYEDLVVQFQDSPDVFDESRTSAALSGYLRDGTLIEGADSICVVP